MINSFNMNFLLDVFVFFKRKNFTILREFDFCDTKVKEYSYGSKKYFTDVWPPPRGEGLPIHKVAFGDEDVTTQVLKFSGPMKNYVNVLSLYKMKKRLIVRFINGGVRFSIEEYWEPREGTVTITDVLGGLKNETLYTRNGYAYISS